MPKQASRPEIEKVAELAMQLSRPHLADYGATRSRKDFTQRQLMVCLILRAYLRTTYRGVFDTLAGNASLRACLGLDGTKLPHFTTVQKFSARSQVAAIAQTIIARIGRAAMAGSPSQPAAMDSTGLDTTSPSAYFESRRGRRHR